MDYERVLARIRIMNISCACFPNHQPGFRYANLKRIQYLPSFPLQSLRALIAMSPSTTVVEYAAGLRGEDHSPYLPLPCLEAVEGDGHHRIRTLYVWASDMGSLNGLRDLQVIDLIVTRPAPDLILRALCTLPALKELRWSLPYPTDGRAPPPAAPAEKLGVTALELSSIEPCHAAIVEKVARLTSGSLVAVTLDSDGPTARQPDVPQSLLHAVALLLEGVKKLRLVGPKLWATRILLDGYHPVSVDWDTARIRSLDRLATLTITGHPVRPLLLQCLLEDLPVLHELDVRLGVERGWTASNPRSPVAASPVRRVVLELCVVDADEHFRTVHYEAFCEEAADQLARSAPLLDEVQCLHVRPSPPSEDWRSACLALSDASPNLELMYQRKVLEALAGTHST